MQTKLDRLKAMLPAGDNVQGLRLAAKWPRLGKHREAITKGAAAALYPEFYVSLGYDPAVLVSAGLAAIKERYKIT